MKKIVLFAILTTTLFAITTSCSKDDDDVLSKSKIIGKWDGTHAKIDGSWMDITSYPQLGFSIQFNSDDSYYGSGYFGNGSGTYKMDGKTITTYVNGKEYSRYVIHSLNNNQAEATMYMGRSSMDIRVQKR